MSFKTSSHIEKELAAIKRGDFRSWGALSLLLDAIEKKGYWHSSADSFTNWLEKNSSLFGVKPAMLWRILTAGRFVRQIREHLTSKGVFVPDLIDMPKAVGPESLELLAKIERAIPRESFIELARRVFSEEAKRAELRSIWQTYRPALGGKTARGRGATTPRLNPSDPEQYESLKEAMILDALKASGPSWFGHDKPEFYHVFLHVTPDDLFIQSDSYMFSAVAAIKPAHREMEYHGFIFNSRSSSNLAAYKEHPGLAYCDLLWIMLPQRASGKSWSLMDRPSFNGMLEVQDGKIQVLKPAERSPQSGKLRDRLISALLRRALGGK